MSEFEVIRLGHLGDGICAGPTYAPLTLPGERISATQNGERLSDIRIVTPSTERVSAPCKHFRRCGGCLLQHASDSFVAAWKQASVAQALAAQGLNTPQRDIFVSAPKSRRRASFSARRNKSGATAGFHMRSSDQIIDIPGCILLDPALLDARPAIMALAETGASRKSEISVLATLSHAGVDLAVTGGKPMDPALRVALTHIGSTHHLARLTWDGETIAMFNAPIQRFGRAQVIPPPGAFLQATLDGEAALLRDVREIVAGAGRVADLFAGCGTFALSLAEDAEIHAVESEAAMLAAMDRGWREAQGLKKVSHESRDLFRRPLLPDELERFHAVVIDPPRAGAEAQVTEIAKSSIEKVAYVSCNPTSFARDAKILCQAGFDLDWLRTVDQFRWSSHIELVACLTRRRKQK